MGPKKRKPPSSSKPPTPPKNVAAGSETLPTSSTSQEQSKTQQLDSATAAAIKEECISAIIALKNKNLAKAQKKIEKVILLNETSGLAHRAQAFIYSQMATASGNNAHFKTAMESAKKSVQLSPNSIESSYFYAYLLSVDVSADKDAVIQECERGLSIQDPIDPAIDALHYSQSQESAEERFSDIREQLRKLIKKSKPDSKMEMTEEKTGEDRMVGGVEIKEAIKTPEEQWEEAAVRVMAEGLLLRKWVQGKLKKEELSRLEKQRKSAIAEEKKNHVRPYWDSMTDDQKRELLKIRISNLMQYLRTSSHGSAERILSEALDFAAENRTWKFWACCNCDKKFTDSDSHLNHLWKELIEKLEFQQQRFQPRELNDVWVKMLENGSWKPVNYVEAFKIIESESKEEVEVEASSLLRFVERFPDGPVDDRWQWPLVDDSERASILEEIHVIIKLALEHKCLTANHVDDLMLYAIISMENSVATSKLLDCGLGQSPECICFLETPRLEKVLEFLKWLSRFCCASKPPETPTLADDAESGIQGYEVEPDITFTDDSSCLRLDERLLSGELFGPQFRAGGDKFLHWLYTDDSLLEDQLTEWRRHFDAQKERAKAINQEINEKAIRPLQIRCNLLNELAKQREVIFILEKLLTEEFKKRSADEQYVPNSFKSLFRMREEGVVGFDASEMSRLKRVISMIIDEAEGGNQSSFETILNGLGLFLLDLYAFQSNLPVMIKRMESMALEEKEDINILIALWRKGVLLGIELYETEAAMIMANAKTRKLQTTISPSSTRDYRSVVLPISKIFIRTNFEVLVKERESEEAYKNFLAELESEKKNVSKGGNQSKQKQKKSKYRGKSKATRMPISSGTHAQPEEEEQEEDVGAYANELKQMGEEQGETMGAKAGKGKAVVEALENGRQDEKEAEQKQLQAQGKNAGADVPEELKQMEEEQGETMGTEVTQGEAVEALDQSQDENEAEQKQLGEQNQKASADIPAETRQTIKIGSVDVYID